jgi:hypothetical protein
VKRNRALLFLIPFAIVLLSLVVYQYGYLRIEEELSDVTEQEAVKKRTLERYVALIAEKPQVETQLSSLKEARTAEDAKLITGQTPSLAAATLQETVRGIITGKGGTISSERVGKQEDFGNFKIVSVSIDAVLPDPRALSDILYSIETRTPYLIVKEVDTRVRNFREPKDVMVKIDVSALYGGK